MYPLIIEKDRLKQAIDRIYDKLAADMNTPLTIEQDYYFDIPMSEAYDIDKDCTPVVGSLVDDWAHLSMIADGFEPVTYVDMDRLAAMLKAISQELNPPAKDAF